jgi:hypothetical protein
VFFGVKKGETMKAIFAITGTLCLVAALLNAVGVVPGMPADPAVFVPFALFGIISFCFAL